MHAPAPARGPCARLARLLPGRMLRIEGMFSCLHSRARRGCKSVRRPTPPGSTSRSSACGSPPPARARASVPSLRFRPIAAICALSHRLPPRAVDHRRWCPGSPSLMGRFSWIRTPDVPRPGTAIPSRASSFSRGLCQYRPAQLRFGLFGARSWLLRTPSPSLSPRTQVPCFQTCLPPRHSQCPATQVRLWRGSGTTSTRGAPAERRERRRPRSRRSRRRLWMPRTSRQGFFLHYGDS